MTLHFLHKLIMIFFEKQLQKTIFHHPNLLSPPKHHPNQYPSLLSMKFRSSKSYHSTEDVQHMHMYDPGQSVNLPQLSWSYDNRNSTENEPPKEKKVQIECLLNLKLLYRCQGTPRSPLRGATITFFHSNPSELLPISPAPSHVPSAPRKKAEVDPKTTRKIRNAWTARFSTPTRTTAHPPS